MKNIEQKLLSTATAMILFFLLLFSCSCSSYTELLTEPHEKDWIVKEVHDKCIIVQNSVIPEHYEHWRIKNTSSYYVGQWIICPDYLRNSYSRP
jgi:hypothetical protein